MLAAGFGELAAQLGARDLADTRDPVASVHAVLAAYPREWLLVFDNARGPGIGGGVLAAGRARAGAGHQPEPQLATRPGAGRAGAGHRGRGGFPGQPHRRPRPAGRRGTGRGAGRAAARARAGRRLHPGHRGQPGQVPGVVPATQGRLLARGEPAGYGKTVATTWSLAFGQLEQSAPAAVGLLRLLACCAPEAIPLSLLLQSRPGLARQLGAEVAPVLVPLLDDPLAASDAIAALRRYSLVIPGGAGSVSVHRLVQAVTPARCPRWPVSGVRPPPP